MLFSSPIFLFVMLPLVVGLHAVLRGEARNWLLLAASLFFYAWGEPVYIVLLIGVSIVTHLVSRWIAASAGRRRRLLLLIGLCVDLGALGLFKYANFVMRTAGLPLEDPIDLPLGISFYTFQASAYLIDVYRSHHPPAPSWHRTMQYISLFPQLVAGPIVRYGQIADALDSRTVDLEGFASGIRRFTIGLAQKVLVADVLAGPVERVYSLPASTLDAPVVWFGTFLFGIQVYFDFAGYSSMAIGMGRMLGFSIPENFNFPYIARSLRDLWRRWHMSLTTWFRDYVYIPMGGNRGTPQRVAFNFVFVFALCGLWHGAAWTFIAWGVYNGLVLVLERTPFGAWLDYQPRLLAQAYTLLAWQMGLMMFRADDLAHTGQLMQAAFGMGAPAEVEARLMPMLTPPVVLAGLVGVACHIPYAARLYRLASERRSLVVVFALLLFSTTAVVARQAVPFIYFRF